MRFALIRDFSPNGLVHVVECVHREGGMRQLEVDDETRLNGVPGMSIYSAELAEAEREGKAAHDAMEEWVSRPLDAPDVPGAVLEAHANVLRASRERIRALLRREGVRDDLEAALARNEQYHRSLGLSIRDRPDPDDESES